MTSRADRGPRAACSFLWLNCVVFHCSCLRSSGETWIRVERRFPGGRTDGLFIMPAASQTSGHRTGRHRQLELKGLRYIEALVVSARYSENQTLPTPLERFQRQTTCCSEQIIWCSSAYLTRSCDA